MPNTRSTFSCISETNVKYLNLWPCISITLGMMNNTVMNCPFPTWIHCVFMQILVMNVRFCSINNAT